MPRGGLPSLRCPSDPCKCDRVVHWFRWRTELIDHPFENLFRLREPTLAVERKSELLPHHLCALERQRHAIVQLYHIGMRLDIAQRKKQIDDNTGFDFEQIGEARLRRDSLHGLRTLADGRVESILVFFRIIDALAKYIRLGVIDLPARKIVYELEHWAVIVRIAARFA